MKSSNANALQHLPPLRILTLLALLGATAPTLAKAANLQVNVDGVRNDHGHLICALFRSAEGFPSTSAEHAWQRLRVALRVPQSQCRFEQLPSGRYAVAVLHDENEDQKINTNLIGVPIEGYGASNNHTHALRAPDFEESAFTFDGADSLAITITLRY